VELESNVLTQSYSSSVALTPGINYEFKVQSRNSVGLSEYSDPVTIFIAQVPDAPIAPVLARAHDQITVNWDEPHHGYTPITSYTVVFRTSDGFSYNTVDWACDGAESNTFTTRSCIVPITAFVTTPFDLPWGTIVNAKVSATNIKGMSEYSPAGTGGTIMTTPDVPADFQKDFQNSNSQQITIIWELGPTYYDLTARSYTLTSIVTG
jgi:hypothetical protein